MKIKDWLDKIRIGIAVGRIASGGKAGKVFDKIEQGTAIAEQAKAIAEMVKQLKKK